MRQGVGTRQDRQRGDHWFFEVAQKDQGFAEQLSSTERRRHTETVQQEVVPDADVLLETEGQSDVAKPSQSRAPCHNLGFRARILEA